MSKEDAVRTAAEALKTAIDDARGAGYRVDWPRTSDGLAAIAVSETAAVKHDEVIEPIPVVQLAEPVTPASPLAAEQGHDVI